MTPSKFTLQDNVQAHSLFERIKRTEWKKFNGQIAKEITEKEILKLSALNEPLTLKEIEDIYLPLSGLMEVHTQQYWSLHQQVDKFLTKRTKKLPFIIGIAGSVAAGKSTTARVLQKVLSLSNPQLKVALVTTDGFLYPNKHLEKHGILNRKGFPESYDTKKLLSFLAAIKSGIEQVSAPVYSHLQYDVIQEETILLDSPDVLILEGINVLQVNLGGKQRGPRVFVSDYFDYSIYVDASEKHLKKWYIERFESLRRTAFQDPKSYFHRYANLDVESSAKMAESIWNEINKPNLIRNILPTKFRANLILEKGVNHAVKLIHLRLV